MGTDSKNDDMTESCLPPPGTASGTTHVLQIANEHYVLRVWDRTADNGQHWVDYVALRMDTPDAYTRRGYHYVGLLTMPAEVERLRAENARLREALAVCISALTDLRIGTVRYMNGPEIYGDFQSAVDYARAALRR